MVSLAPTIYEFWNENYIESEYLFNYYRFYLSNDINSYSFVYF